MTSTAQSQDIVAATLPASPKSLPRVAIAGERNSGKTTLANRILGEPLLPTSFVTRTWLPTIIQYGDQTRLLLQRRNGRHVAASWHDVTGGVARGRKLFLSTPSQRLRHLRIVDTPGFTGDLSEDRSTRCECERADVVLWCTSAVQAWKGSERDHWLSLPLRVRAKGILVVTFADLLGRQQDVTRVLERLRAEANYFSAIVLASEIDDVIALGAQRVARVIRHSRRSDRQVADTPVLAAV